MHTIIGTGGGAIFDNHTTTASAFVSQSCIVGRLRVILRGSHTFNSDMTVRLSSPSGQTFTLQRRTRRTPFRTHTVPRAVGLPAQGTWNLSIADTVRLDAGRLTAFVIELTCQ
ncbi:MAG: proprotein convertase P-domain-containing protein [Deltaproteobacteria bacterium]|nr:proprotein convertase P-domain-containing protein [Deltaproteobacteria bacterium]